MNIAHPSKSYERKLNYTFDSCGHYVEKGLLSSKDIATARSCLADLSFVQDAWAPHQSRASCIHLAGCFLTELDTLLRQHPITRQVIGYPARLIESYALTRSGGSLGLHGGASEHLIGTDIRDISARSWVEDGKLYSLRVKVLLYLDDVNNVSDGRLLYIEGSHKAAFSFHRTFPGGRDEASQLLRAVELRAGDAVWLNEALLHGAERKTSTRLRRLLAYTYAPVFMSNWIELPPNDTSGGYMAAETEQEAAQPSELE